MTAQRERRLGETLQISAWTLRRATLATLLPVCALAGVLHSGHYPVTRRFVAHVADRDAARSATSADVLIDGCAPAGLSAARAYLQASGDAVSQPAALVALDGPVTPSPLGSPCLFRVTPLGKLARTRLASMVPSQPATIDVVTGTQSLGALILDGFVRKAVVRAN